MPLFELTVTYGYSISGFHSRMIHTCLLALEKMLEETTGKKMSKMFSTSPTPCYIHFESTFKLNVV